MKISMLNKNFSYIALDFETTGLDLKKDEPIQVGLVKCDHTGTVTDAFVSYIKPTKDIKDLKQQVSLITGLELSDVIDAPERAIVYDSLKKYLSSDSILIGHNIGFDIGFLHKYRENFQYEGEVDTYVLAQAMMHFQKSYALESLTHTLYKDQEYLEIYHRIKSEVEKLSSMKAHDALYDSVQASALFFFCISKIKKLALKYDAIGAVANKISGIRGSILTLEGATDKKVTLPLMEKPFTSTAKPVNNSKESLQQKFKKKLYVGDKSLKDFLYHIGNKKVVLSFSHGSKLEIAKNHLQNIGYSGISYLKQEQYLDQYNVTQWLNKSEHNQEEFLFVCKYIAQVEKGMGVLDIRSSEDRQIFHSIKKSIPFQPQDIVLCSHGGLYALLEGKLELDTEWLKEYTIIYCDLEWWYTSYNKYANSPFDFYQLLELLETFEYKYKIRTQTVGDIGFTKTYEALQDVVKSVSIFIPILYDEVKHQYKGKNKDKLELNPIYENPLFLRTTKLWDSVKEKIKSAYVFLNANEKQRLQSLIKRAHSVLNSLVKVQNRVMNNYGYYTFSYNTNFTDYTEFLEMFEGFNWIQASHISRNDEERTYDKHYDNQKLPFDMIRIDNKYDFVEKLKKRHTKDRGEPNIFVISNKRHVSKGLLDLLYAQGFHKKYELIVEGVTGGIGKNTIKVAKKGAKIIIGGYHFLLNIFASKQNIDMGFILCIDGPLKDSILDDVHWYGSQSIE